MLNEFSLNDPKKAKETCVRYDIFFSLSKIMFSQQKKKKNHYIGTKILGAVFGHKL
jgi:hypothetical protein